MSFAFSTLPSCQAEPGHQPGIELGAPINTKDPNILLSLLISTSTPESSRQSADQLYLQQKSPTDESRLAILEQILYAPGHSDPMRIYALDQLAAADPNRAAQSLNLYLPRFDSPVLDHACQLAITLGDPRLLPTLARSLDRIAQDDATTAEQLRARPEFPALEKLSNQPANKLFLSMLTSERQSDARIAALDCLQKILPPAEAITQLLSIPQSNPDPWLADLTTWAKTFNALPVGTTEFQWIQLLHRPENSPLLARALDRHKILAKESDYHPAPRFITTLAYIDDATLRLPRETLLANLKSQLDPLPHIHREANYKNSPEDKDESLAANAPLLSRADLFNIHLLLATLRDPATRAEFQRQGLADLSDTTTEHGGLLSLQNIAAPTLLITPFPPLYNNTDLEYVTDDKLLKQAPLGIALYHFHFQQIQNAPRAGPGEGDFNFAHKNRTTCLVITSTATRQINLDYYTPNAAVVDLGVYTQQNP